MKAAVATLCVLVSTCAVGCLTPPSPAQQAQDFQNAMACVQKDWGKPVGTIAQDCTGSLLPAAEDIVADVEAIIEGTAVLAGQPAPASPYASEPHVVALVATKRADYLSTRQVSK